MFEAVNDLLTRYGDNKLAWVVLGALLTKFLPFAVRVFSRAFMWTGQRLGGRFAYLAFEQRYLDWLVIELRELRLTGIVSFDDSKKPRLEQVFVSLSVGEQREDLPPVSTVLLEEFLAVHRSKRAWRDLTKLLRRPAGAEESNDLRTALLRRLEGPPSVTALTEQAGSERLARFRYVFRARVKPRLRRLIRRPGIGSEVADSKRLVADLEKIVIDWAISSGIRANGIEAIQLKRLLRENSRMAILGPPGSGKSTLLQYVGLTHARHRCSDKKLRNRRLLKGRLGVSRWQLPMFIPLASVASALLRRPGDSLDPSLVDAYPSLLPPDLQSDPVCRAFLTARLERGRCLVLLDGLDEVPTEAEFQASVRAIESLAIRYPENRFIVTSRIAGWRSGLNTEFPIYFVRDLTNKQVESFIDTWYSAVELNAVSGRLEDESPIERAARVRRATQKAGALKNALAANVSIRRLAANPMLLSIIALVHRGLAVLPRERQKLYGECAKILLEQWDVSRGVRVDDTNLKLEQKEALLRRVAYALHSGETGDREGGREAPRSAIVKLLQEVLPDFGRPAADAAKLLQRLIERSGIITERRRDVLAFSHLTFQEYFAARHLASEDSLVSSSFLLAKERLFGEWWREVILLYVGILTDASAFIRSVYSEPVRELCDERLRVAGMCTGEASGIRDASLRSEIGLELIELRLGQRPKAGSSVDLEVLGYLSDFAASRRWYPAAARLTSRRHVEAGTTGALGDLFLRALTDPAAVVRRAAAEGLSQAPAMMLRRPVVESLAGLLADPDPHVREASLQALLCGANDLPEEVVGNLRKTLDGSEVERSWALSLVQNASERRIAEVVTLEFVRSCIHSKDWEVRQRVAGLLPRVIRSVGAEVVKDALELACDYDEDVTSELQRALTSLLDMAEVRNVIEKWALEGLDAKGDERLFASMAMLALMKDVSLATLQKVANLMQYARDNVRQAAIGALTAVTAGKRDTAVRELLLGIVSRAKGEEGVAVWEILRRSGGLATGEEAAFSRAMNDAGAGRGSLAREAIGLIVVGDELVGRFRPEIRQLLEGRLRVREGSIRAAALEALAQIVDDGELAAVVGKGLHDRSQEVGRAAVRVLIRKEGLPLRSEWTTEILRIVEATFRSELSLIRVLHKPFALAQRLRWRRDSPWLLASRSAPVDWVSILPRLSVRGNEDATLARLLRIAWIGPTPQAQLSVLTAAAQLVRGSEARFETLINAYLEQSGRATGIIRRYERVLHMGRRWMPLYMPTFWGEHDLERAMWRESLSFDLDGTIVRVPSSSRSMEARRQASPLVIALESLVPSVATRRVVALLESSEPMRRLLGLQVVCGQSQLVPLSAVRPLLVDTLRDPVSYVRSLALMAAGSVLERARDEQLIAAVRGLLVDGERNICDLAWETLAAVLYRPAA